MTSNFSEFRIVDFRYFYARFKMTLSQTLLFLHLTAQILCVFVLDSYERFDYLAAPWKDSKAPSTLLKYNWSDYIENWSFLWTCNTTVCNISLCSSCHFYYFPLCWRQSFHALRQNLGLATEQNDVSFWSMLRFVSNTESLMWYTYFAHRG